MVFLLGLAHVDLALALQLFCTHSRGACWCAWQLQRPSLQHTLVSATHISLCNTHPCINNPTIGSCGKAAAADGSISPHMECGKWPAGCKMVTYLLLEPQQAAAATGG